MKRSRNATGGVVSAGLHGILILVAAYATASGAAAEREPEPKDVVHWVPASKAPVPAVSTPARSNRVGFSSKLDPPQVLLDFSAPSISVEIAMPFADFNDFASTDSSKPANGGSPSSNRGYDENRSYVATEVEIAASAIASTSGPEYPVALRASGIEGEVVAQFVVSQNGIAQVGSVRIISATNDLFAQSVKRALLKMRFVPARVGDRAVAQVVQQLFVFRLDR